MLFPAMTLSQIDCVTAHMLTLLMVSEKQTGLCCQPKLITHNFNDVIATGLKPGVMNFPIIWGYT